MPHTSFKWTVIGAGPAGIAAVGKLLDQGIAPEQIAWIDPEFKVGDFGTQWHKVSSNTRIGLFFKFYESCASFNYSAFKDHCRIKDLNPTDTCLLDIAAEPLQHITQHLCEKVHSFTDKVQHLKLHDRHWELTLTHSTLRSKNVILATGAEPKSLNFSGIADISVKTALDPDKLRAACQPHDVIAVFGASHSAMIILQSLLEECNVRKVINFYLNPLRYAVYLSDWILFDDTGLKGKTAEWARTHIDGKQPPKLTRLISIEENIRTHLPLCTKAIYAVGFEKRLIPIEGMHQLEYNDRSGIIAPGLFGLGIAFPEAKLDPFGTLEYRVGLWKFMEYLNRVMSVWLQYGV